MFLALFLTACTDKSPHSNKDVVEYSVTSQGSGEFGIVPYPETVVKSFTFKNDTSQAAMLTPSIIGANGADFNIGLALGCENVLPGKSCLVKVIFNSQNKESGQYSAQLQVADLSLNLSAEILSVPSVNYEVLIDNQNSQESVVNLGNISGENFKLLSLKIKNNSPKRGVVSSLTSSNTRFNLVANNCINVSLKPNQSCTAKMWVKGQNTDEVLSTTLSFDNKSLSLELEQQGQTLVSNLTAFTPQVEMGDFYLEKNTKIQPITITNLGDGVGSITSLSLPPEYSLASNNCLSVKPGKSCVIRLFYKAELTTKGPNSQDIDLGDSIVILNSNQVSNPNSLTTITISEISQSLLINQCYRLSIKLSDNEGLDFVSSTPTVLSVSNTLYEDSNCTQESSSLDSFESSKNFYIKASEGQEVNLVVNKGVVQSQISLNFYNILTPPTTPSVLIVNQSLSVTPIGGKEPYSYSIVNGIGSVSSSGIFNSQSLAGSSQIKIQDSLGQEVLVSIQVVDVLSAQIISFEKVVNQTQNIQGLGGLPPYNYIKLSGVGTINSSTGEFLSGSIPGVVQIKIIDALNQEVMVSGQVYDQLVAQNLNPSLTISNQISLIPTGGKTPYSYVKLSGPGVVDGSNFSSNTAGNTSIKISDALGQDVIVNALINSNLTLTAGTCNANPLLSYKSCTLTTSGGVGDITLSTTQGEVNSSTKVLKPNCLNNSGSFQVTAQDSFGNTASLNLNATCVYSGCSEIKAKGYALTNGFFWIDMDGYLTENAQQLYCDIENNSYTEIFDLVRQPSLTAADIQLAMAKFSNTPLTIAQTFKDANGVYWKNTSGIEGLSYGINKYPLGSIKIRVNRVSESNGNQGGFALHSSDRTGCSSNWSLGTGCTNNLYRIANYSNVPQFVYSDGTVGSSAWSYEGINGAVPYSSAQNLEHILDQVPEAGAYLTSFGRTEGSPAVQSIFHTTQLKIKDIYHHRARTCAEAKTKGQLNLSLNTGSGVYVLDNDGFELKNPESNVYCDMTSLGEATITNSCLDAKRFNQKNSLTTTASGTYVLDLDGVGVGSATTQNIYCDQESLGGGWALLSNSSQSNGSYPATTGLSTTQNFDLQPLFSSSVNSSNKLVKIKNGIIGEYIFESGKRWKLRTDGNQKLDANDSTSGVTYIWNFNQSYSVVYPHLGNPTSTSSWCNGSNGFSIWMNRVGNPGVGIFVGSNAYQGGCNSNSYYSVGFNWQVFTR